MAENKQVTDLPVVSTPDEGDIYIVKGGVDARVRTGEPLGLATLGADGILDASQRPASSGTAWGDVTGTLSAQTDLQSALNAKQDTLTTGNLVAGTNVTLTGTLTNRLVGTGNVTITATGGGGSATWGAITGTLSSQTDLQTALNAKANTSHTHAASDITSGTFSTSRIPSLPASQITSGNFDVARLGTGTADTTKFLRGDGSWQTVSSGSATWGSISGTLSSQTDLQSALDAKASTSHVHAASDITSGVMATARLGTGTANSGTFLRGDGTWAATSSGAANWGSISGTLSSQTDLQTALDGKAAASHTHVAGDITSGVFSTARLGTGTPTAGKYLAGDGTWTTLTAGNTWGAITGTLSNQTDLQTALNGKASTSHTHSGSDITSGTVATARLGSGTANSTTFLRGDGSWQVPSLAVTWGSITGTLSNQTDLQAALDGKSNTGHTHAASDVTSGSFALARLGGGTPTTTNFLNGAGIWRAVEFSDIAVKPTTIEGYGITNAPTNTGTYASGTWNINILGNSATTSQTSWPALSIGSGYYYAVDANTVGIRSGTGGSYGYFAFNNSAATINGSTLWHAGNDGAGSGLDADLLDGQQGAYYVNTSTTQTVNGAKTFGSNVTAPDFIATSDERLKYNIVDALPRDRLADMLRFVSFMFIADDEEKLGLIAQEVLEVAPEYVYVGDDGYLGIDKAGIALEAVLGLAKRVRELEAKVA